MGCRGPADIDIAATPRRRADVNVWAYERACVPIDPEVGPSWHLGMLPLEDTQYRGTAVSLVASHTVADGLGLVDAITDAVKGRTRNPGYLARSTNSV